jgi:hypothetical protein
MTHFAAQTRGGWVAGSRPAMVRERQRSFDQALAVLPGALPEVARQADMERAVLPVGQHVNGDDRTCLREAESSLPSSLELRRVMDHLSSAEALPACARPKLRFDEGRS